MSDASTVLKMIKDNEVQYVDLRFTDPRGKMQHVTLDIDLVDEDFFAEGTMFDGSSIAGWKAINESDMVLMPDCSTAKLDPFYAQQTLTLFCNILEPNSGESYNRDPRSTAVRAEEYLKSTGIGDTVYFGPEAEFFVFDDVRFSNDPYNTGFALDSVELPDNSGTEYETGNMGHRPRTKGGYFPVNPVDSGQDLRGEMLAVMKEIGMEVEKHHHEVAAAQHELGLKFGTMTAIADDLQLYKYVVHNVAHAYGKTATFMPKPVAGDNGTGMHCHQSIFKDGEAALCRQPVRRPERKTCLYLHRRHPEARQVRLNAFHQPVHQLLQAFGSGLTKRRFCWPIRPATVPPPVASPTSQIGRRASAWKSASRTRRQTLTCRLPPCSWPASTASRTRFDPGEADGQGSLRPTTGRVVTTFRTVCASLREAHGQPSTSRPRLPEEGQRLGPTTRSTAIIELKMGRSRIASKCTHHTRSSSTCITASNTDTITGRPLPRPTERPHCSSVGPFLWPTSRPEASPRSTLFPKAKRPPIGGRGVRTTAKRRPRRIRPQSKVERYFVVAHTRTSTAASSLSLP